MPSRDALIHCYHNNIPLPDELVPSWKTYRDDLSRSISTKNHGIREVKRQLKLLTKERDELREGKAICHLVSLSRTHWLVPVGMINSWFARAGAGSQVKLAIQASGDCENDTPAHTLPLFDDQLPFRLSTLQIGPGIWRSKRDLQSLCTASGSKAGTWQDWHYTEAEYKPCHYKLEYRIQNAQEQILTHTTAIRKTSPGYQTLCGLSWIGGSAKQFVALIAIIRGYKGLIQQVWGIFSLKTKPTKGFGHRKLKAYTDIDGEIRHLWQS
ncbi:hypothetical protein BKA70DRAFT_1231781 [Coprinopsis sp. MPI-PUGE-AT-0042]|nr:hypothetical protein BKA70DRAFT_1231781 [Coprinopsis sp. MPI-PUGE-AT-0042]